MALRAVAKVLREADLAVVVHAVLVAPDHVVLAALAVVLLRVQQPARVDLVDHRGHRQHVAAVGVGRRCAVTEHAVLDVDAATAMQRQRLVAAVAGTDVGHHAGLGRVGDGHRAARTVEGDIEVRIDAHGLAGGNDLPTSVVPRLVMMVSPPSTFVLSL